jgi:hypothetical protein
MRWLPINLARRHRTLLLAALATLGLAASAIAFWSGQGSGTASGSVGTLAAPTGAGASSTVGSSTVAVSWTASTPIDGVSPSGYYVKRYDGATPSTGGGDCGTPAAPVDQTSCNDTEVADGTYTYTVVAVYHSWTAESAHSSSVTVVGDATPPTTTLTTTPASPEGANGWFEQASVSFTLSAEDAGSGVPAGSTFYRIDGGETHTYSGAVAISSQGDHVIAYWSVDGAGNEESPHPSTHIKLDSVGPTNALSLGAANHALLSGSTVYFNGSLPGSFTLTNGVSDATSGPSSATFPVVSAANWTHAAETVSSPSGGPYTSSTYSWTSGAATPSGAQAVFTSTDNAGNSSANTILAFASDTTAPTGGAVTVNGTAASAGGSTSTATSTGFAISARTNYSESQSASQSGLASSTLTIQSESLSGNACGAPGSAGAYTTATTISGTTNPTIATGFCYLYTLTGTDNVGNDVTIKTTVRVDTTAPSSPTVSLSSATGNTFVSGTTAYIAAQAGKSGSFKAIGSSSDVETGVTSIKLPSLAGFTSGGGTLSSPFETTYTWSGAVGASGAQGATATNGAGLTATNASAFTITSDTSVPTGAALTVNGTAASAGGSTSTSTSTVFAISARTDYSEAQSATQSGLASSTLTVQSETLTGNVCGAPGSGGEYTSPTTITGTSNPAIATGFCYLYTLTGTDNVGNTVAVKTTVRVDNTGPSSPTVSLTSATGNTFISGTTVYLNAQAGKEGSFKATGASTDAESGIASIKLPALTGFSEGGGTLSSPFETKYKWSGAVGASGAESATATNGFGLTATNASAFTVTPDTTAPAGGALSVNGTAASGAGSASTATETGFAIDSRTDYAETQTPSASGLASSTLTIQSATLTGNTCAAAGSGGKYTTATTVGGTTQPAIETGFCYVYTLAGTDNVGNAVAIKTTVKVDATGPSSPSVTLSTAVGSTFVSGTTVYINAQAGKEGSFKATGASTDSQTGVTTITLPSLTGFSEGGGTLSSPFETKYKWSGAVAASGAQSVTATNGVGLTTTNSSAFTVTPDTTAPAGGSVSVPTRVKALSVSVTFSGGTDSGSGVSTASGELQRAEATYTGSSDSCGSFGAFAKVSSAGPSSPFSDTTVASGKCYQYQYKVADNVGNATTYGPSGTLKVNTSGPALTSMSTAGGNGILETGDVLTLTFSQTILASSVPTSGTIVQAKAGGGANATVSITGLGTEWSLGSSSAYQTSKTSAEFNETASVSGSTATVTVGSKVGGTTPIAGSANTVTGTLSSSVKDVFENNASATAFSLTSTKLW